MIEGGIFGNFYKDITAGTLQSSLWTSWSFNKVLYSCHPYSQRSLERHCFLSDRKDSCMIAVVHLTISHHAFLIMMTYHSSHIINGIAFWNQKGQIHENFNYAFLMKWISMGWLCPHHLQVSIPPPEWSSLQLLQTSPCCKDACMKGKIIWMGILSYFQFSRKPSNSYFAQYWSAV